MSSLEISIDLQFSTTEFRARDQQNVRFTLTNNSNETIHVLKWNTPLEGIKNDIFNIEKDGKRTVYLGKMVKRGAPRPEDYITREPKSSVSVEVDLTQYYDISEPGEYDVRYNKPILDVGKESPHLLARRFVEQRNFPIQPIQLDVARFMLLEQREPKQINGILVERLAEHRDTNATQPPNFISCSTTQQTDLDGALKEAEKIANEAKCVMLNTSQDRRPEAIRYKEWFGSYDNQRYDKVTSNFSKILDAVANKTMTFNCSGDGCEPNDYAYVIPGSPYEIHICSSFWTAPLTGTDSRAGTIVHETSHFDVVAGTDDNAYSQGPCRQLAINNPDDAIANADSHEYFAENSPPLSMYYILSLNDIFGRNNITRPVSIRSLAQDLGFQPPISLRALLCKLGP